VVIFVSQSYSVLAMMTMTSTNVGAEFRHDLRPSFHLPGISGVNIDHASADCIILHLTIVAILEVSDVQ